MSFAFSLARRRAGVHLFSEYGRAWDGAAASYRYFAQNVGFRHGFARFLLAEVFRSKEGWWGRGSLFLMQLIRSWWPRIMVGENGRVLARGAPAVRASYDYMDVCHAYPRAL